MKRTPVVKQHQICHAWRGSQETWVEERGNGSKWDYSK